MIYSEEYCDTFDMTQLKLTDNKTPKPKVQYQMFFSSAKRVT